MRTRRGLIGLVVAIGWAWSIAVPAVALPPGVFVDPGSPAGKEYSFSLSVLRGQAGGSTPVPGDPATPLFGIGGGSVTASGRTGSSEVSGQAAVSLRPLAQGNDARNVARAAPARGFSGPLAGRLISGQNRTARPDPSASLERLGSTGSGTTAPIALLAGAVLLGGLALGAALAAIRARKH